MSSHTGSCLCGEVKWSIEGSPDAIVVCHCIACRKTASASASNDLIIHADKLKVEGPTRTWSRKGDSGKSVTYNYCATCPTIVTVDIEVMKGIMIVKAGTCDDEELLKTTPPKREIFTKNRYPWVQPCKMAEQSEAA